MAASLRQIDFITVSLTKAGGSMPGCEFVGSDLMKALFGRGCNWNRQKNVTRFSLGLETVEP